jgi:hypothetical protein
MAGLRGYRIKILLVSKWEDRQPGCMVRSAAAKWAIVKAAREPRPINFRSGFSPSFSLTHGGIHALPGANSGAQEAQH